MKRRQRQAFTIVELLVAMALIMFIMAILSTAFVAATSTFRNLKASGDMAEKLRATSQVLQRDLAYDHFGGKQRLSNPNFWINGPPEQGFFQLYQGSAPGVASVPATVPPIPCAIEGQDLDGVGSFRSVDHALAFTIKLRGNQMGDFLSASGGMAALSGAFGPPESRYQSAAYNYQWAEVAWFLVPSLNPVTPGVQDTTAADLNTGSPGVPLFTLMRRQRLAVPDNSLVQPPQPATPANLAQFLEVSSWANSANNQLYFNSPTDLTVPQRRFGGSMPPPAGVTPLPLSYPTPITYTTIAQQLTALGAANSTLAGADIQLTDVVSFDVRLLVSNFASSGADPFVTLFQLPTTNGGPFTYTSPLPPGASGMVFDTWSSLNDGLTPAPMGFAQWNVPNQPGISMPLLSANVVQMGPIIQAIQISIRIWDAKTNQTRQVTIIQAM